MAWPPGQNPQEACQPVALGSPSVLLAELVHPASRIDEALLARIEWMASGANFDVQLLAKC